MRADRKTAEEQYRLIIECRGSGMTDTAWCRKHGINPETFATWIRRLKKKGGFHIPQASKHSANGNTVNDIVKVDILPEEAERRIDGTMGNPAVTPSPGAGTSSIEIELHGAVFRFSGQVDPLLYEKALLLIGGKLL